MQTFNQTILATFLTILWSLVDAQVDGSGNMVKMCLFYPNPSGHGRTDPIISQNCASDHVHTFYGPQNFHPNTSYENIRDTKSQHSSTPFIENQSLYWHPSFYRVSENADNTKTYTRISSLETSPYYRWDNSVDPKTEAFPPGFRMIAYSNQDGSDGGGETGGNLFVECCDMVNGEESCTDTTGALEWPQKNCDFVGIAFAMPTCWNGQLGINNNHIDHMAYTVDGTVAGDCPTGFNRRLPQIQLFVRIENYRGNDYTYTLSDESDVFHVDFMNGWEEGKLENIINNCEVIAHEPSYNPPCNCVEEFMTPNPNPSGSVCDADVRNFIIDEATDVVSSLPRGTCTGTLKDKSWVLDPPFTCSESNDDENTGNNDTETEDDDNEEPECVDSPLRFFYRKRRKRMSKDCAWVEENPTKRCKHKRIANHCRATCAKCETCTDSKLKFQFTDIDDNVMKKRCNWVKKDPDERCESGGIEDTCRETCDMCG